uniref:Uncharacterized protein n=1 Tax=Octactis speculum TaxID=3111310 RepID=A0A7S2GG94_9STRA|mmetsp:Transcript_47524/g.64699  ORF Transcript_47524/g.64699 Transcript_47524/m.64699 type:complete len:152 (+) Transcript_47524:132-587(+)
MFPRSSVIVSSALTVVLATAFPRFLGKLAETGELVGSMLLYLFFATAGAAGGTLGQTVVGAGPVLLLYLTVLYSVHLGVLLTLGKLLNMPRPVLLTASNANIGGPATACALCEGRKWYSLTAPALLVGNLGYIVANGIGLLFYAFWTSVLK